MGGRGGLVTEWNQFRALDLDRIQSVMMTPVFVDLRNIYRHADVEAAGFNYIDIGCGAPWSTKTIQAAAEQIHGAPL